MRYWLLCFMEKAQFSIALAVITVFLALLYALIEHHEVFLAATITTIIINIMIVIGSATICYITS